MNSAVNLGYVKKRSIILIGIALVAIIIGVYYREKFSILQKQTGYQTGEKIISGTFDR